ncbi:MAG: hypothetical protein ACRC50_14380 [Gaiella sp.]
MLLEALFFLVLLKIPVVYLCVVVWWAIRAEPATEPPLAPVTVSDTPSPPDPVGWAPRGGTPRRASDGRAARRPSPRTPAPRETVRR